LSRPQQNVDNFIFAMAHGLNAALAALIVSTQPLLTTGLAVFIFGERPKLVQWAGIFIGFFGVILVLSPTLEVSAAEITIGSCIFGLFAITAGTLIQKQIGNSINLLKSNIVQAAAARLFFMTLITTIASPKILWTKTFIISLTRQVLAVSTGAYVILMFLIKKNSIAATTSLMYMVPPTTAIIAFFILGEPPTPISVSGFFMTSCGVHLVTHYAKTIYPDSHKGDEQDIA